VLFRSPQTPKPQNPSCGYVKRVVSGNLTEGRHVLVGLRAGRQLDVVRLVIQLVLVDTADLSRFLLNAHDLVLYRD